MRKLAGPRTDTGGMVQARPIDRARARMTNIFIFIFIFTDGDG